MRATIGFLATALGGALACLALAGAAEPYKAAPGPAPVEAIRLEWRDAARDCSLPVKVYLPTGATSACPVILFSHGLGGSREGYSYLGEHWASHGYVCVHLQHPGSDETVWRGAARPRQSMQAAAADGRNALHRARDVKFALDELARLAVSDPALRGRLDLERVGMAGHSFGAWTTLAVVGQGGGAGRLLADPRIKAAIAMSAPAPKGDPDAAFRNVRVPVLHLTGTRDDSPIGDTRPEQRRVPFDHIRAPGQYLVTFAGGDHMVFSGRSGLRGDRSKDDVFHELIRQVTTAYWDAYLRDDAAARRWLADGGFEQILGKHGVFERKPAPAR